jgi:hypothetical protein
MATHDVVLIAVDKNTRGREQIDKDAVRDPVRLRFI